MTDHIVKTIGANRLVLRDITLKDGFHRLLVRQRLSRGEWIDDDTAGPLFWELVQEVCEELLAAEALLDVYRSGAGQ